MCTQLWQKKRVCISKLCLNHKHISYFLPCSLAKLMAVESTKKFRDVCNNYSNKFRPQTRALVDGEVH